MGQRKTFTPEFKREAVQLLESGSRPASQIARELGIKRLAIAARRNLSSRRMILNFVSVFLGPPHFPQSLNFCRAFP